MPDLIVTNASVLTMEAGSPSAGGVPAWAVAVRDGRIVAVGPLAKVEALARQETRVIDAGGRTLLPGFFENHLHVGLGGSELAHLHLAGVRGLDALRAAFAAFSAANPGQPLLMGQSAGYDLVPGGLTRQVLDAVMPDRPIALTSYEHHTVWANTAALRAAGLLHGAAMPRGHEVVMGPDGLASGELREFEAFAPVIALGGDMRLNLGIATGAEPHPWPAEAERAVDRAKIAAGLAHAAAHGITSMVNMDGNRYTLELLRDLQAASALTARVKVPFHFKPGMALSELDRAEAMTRDFADDWLQSGFVKMFMDGVIDSFTAHLLQDYPGRTGFRAAPLFEPEWFAEVAREIDRRGLQMAVHAVGDGAVRTTLDGYAAARAANGARDSRHRIEHIELIDRADVARLGALGIVASVQPPHAPGAMDFGLQPTMDMIGQRRWRDAYQWRSLADAGSRLCFASDWPIADLSVLRGVQAALTRVPYDGAADERIGLLDTLHAYTAGGAYAAHRDHAMGRLASGLAGDMVLLDGNIETLPPQDIGAMGIALTVCGGRITHQAPGFG